MSYIPSSWGQQGPYRLSMANMVPHLLHGNNYAGHWQTSSDALYAIPSSLLLPEDALCHYHPCMLCEGFAVLQLYSCSLVHSR